MNRYFSVFMVVVAFCGSAFSQSTNIPGGASVDLSGLQFSGSGVSPDNYAANIDGVGDLVATNSSAFIGGAGGSFTPSGETISQSGGTGLRLTDVGSTTIADSELRGGKGSSIVADNGKDSFFAEGKGGHAIELNGDSDLDLETGAVVVGGTGGTVNNDNGRGKAFGGDGINRVAIIGDASVANITVFGGSYQGGKGGSAIYNNNELIDPNGSDDVFFENLDGARGGNGLRVSSEDGWYNGVQAGTVVIHDGTFAGGNGGTAQNAGVGPVVASGGNGVLADYTDVFIYGGNFSGGVGGSENGSKGADGYGVRTRESNLTITNGTFANQGVWFESQYLDNTATISGGTFGEAVFTATLDDFNPTGNRTINTINISGGTFDRVRLNGEETNDATIMGGSITSLMLEGTGINNLSIATPVTISSVTQNGGTANITQWDDHHFQNTTISAGTMNFSGNDFNLLGGGSLALKRTSAGVSFDKFTATSGSQITTMHDGTVHSAITGSEMVFEEGVKWTIHGVNTLTNKATFTMASATTSMDSDLLDSDIEYIGASWASAVTADVVNNDLIGTYGFLDLQDALDLEPGTDFYMAMEQLSNSNNTDFANSGSDEFLALKDQNLTQEAANISLQEKFVNNAMVGVVIQLQGIFADQIQDRTRSHLRYKDWAAPVSSPQGAQGPDSVPSWDVSQSMRNMSDKPPRTEDDSIKIPETYQVWGRGYGAYLKQDGSSDLVGYDAMIGGGVLGLDKRFNNLLLGVGGGYANTWLNGDGGSHDRADSFYGTAYAGATSGKGFLDFNINYAFNEVETEGSAVTGSYEADYDASTFSMYLGGGWGFSTFNDSVLITPEASLLTTYYTRDSYTERTTTTDPWSDLAWDSYDQWSYLSSLGATFSSIHQFESFNFEMELQPEIRAHWLHEFNADMDKDSYIMGNEMTPIGVAIQGREEDLVRVGAGIRFSQWDSETLEFGLDFDGVFGKDYDAYIISGKLLHRF